MMEAKHIQLLNKAKKRLGSAIKRFRQAEAFLDEFRAAVPAEEKTDWANVPVEYHMLSDCRRNIRGARHLTLRLLFQIHRVNFLERRKRFLLLTEADKPDQPSQD